nr:MAG TPA: hypothetical protein [Caudoviricetes sp.]
MLTMTTLAPPSSSTTAPCNAPSSASTKRTSTP